MHGSYDSTASLMVDFFESDSCFSFGLLFAYRVSDFGLAKMMQGNSIQLSKTTNPRWTAPEVIKESKIGTAGDVYSFAIIMWEILTFQQPYEDMMSIQVSDVSTVSLI
jgi:serine/threonine protein kinase